MVGYEDMTYSPGSSGLGCACCRRCRFCSRGTRCCRSARLALAVIVVQHDTTATAGTASGSRPANTTTLSTIY